MATTPRYALPYPVGTDRVMDGDNAIQALAERVEALMPRVLGQVNVITPQGGIGATAVQIAGLAVNTTGQPAGHRLRVTCYVPISQSVAAGRIDMWLLQDGANVEAASQDAAAGGFRLFHMAVIVPSTAGAHGYTVNVSTTGGSASTTVIAAQPAWLMVEDLGSIT